MAMVVRQSSDLLSSLLAMVMLCIRRHNKIYASIPARVCDDHDDYDIATPATQSAFDDMRKVVLGSPLATAQVSNCA